MSELNLVFDQDVRVYFKAEARRIVFGQFVKAKDHDELAKKGYVRLASYSFDNLPSFRRTNNLDYTRVIKVETIHSIVKQ